MLTFLNNILTEKKGFNTIYFLCVLTLLTVQISFADSISPNNLLSKRGQSSEQMLEVLAVKDQQATADNWDNYIEFTPSTKGYTGIFRFTLPTNTSSLLDTLDFIVNYRGAEKSFQRWVFQLLNVQTGKWIYLADNTNVQDWVWSEIKASIKNPEQYINEYGQVIIRYKTRSSVDNSQLDFMTLASNANKLSATPKGVTVQFPLHNNASYWQPTPGLSWQIQYTKTLNTSLNVDVYNIDLFDTDTGVISRLHANGKKVICYFSAGSYENWRPDVADFPKAILGRNLEGWAGEKWLDVRRLDVLIPIMRNRIQLAAKKGCDAVDPDNIDGYGNNTGFPISYSDQLAYNKALSHEAHQANIAIGLKNDLGQIQDLMDYFDFATNESCIQYNECDLLKPFVNSGKAVFGIEYTLAMARFCPQVNALNFDFLKKNLSLNASRKSCR